MGVILSFLIRLLFLSTLGLVTNPNQGCCFSRISPFSCVCMPRICFQGSQIQNACEDQRTPLQCWHRMLPGKGQARPGAAPSLAVGIVLQVSLVNPE